MSEQVKHVIGNQSKDRQGSEEADGADGTGKPEKRQHPASKDCMASQSTENRRQ